MAEARGVLDAQGLLAATCSEEDLLAFVMDTAEMQGWRTLHIRPARTKDGGWRTPVQGHGKGFPDVLALREGRCVIAELKSERAPGPDHDQHLWLLEWELVPGAEVYTWRPRDIPTIEEVFA